MTPQVLIIPGRLPALNEMLAGARKSRGRYSAFAKVKKDTDATIVAWIRAQGITPLTVLPIDIDYLWVEHNRQRDKSNVAGGGRKFIEDSLQKAGIIPNDGWKEIGDWNDRWLVDKVEPRIEVTLGADLQDIRRRIEDAVPGTYVPGYLAETEHDGELDL